VVFIVRFFKRGEFEFSTILEGAAAALITAPLMAVLLMAGLGESAKNWTLLLMALLNALFLWFGGSLILPERQGWKHSSDTDQ
jgi:hypothetical protein